MRDVNKENISDVFMSYLGADVNPRLREVMQSLVITFMPLRKI